MDENIFSSVTSEQKDFAIQSLAVCNQKLKFWHVYFPNQSFKSYCVQVFQNPSELLAQIPVEQRSDFLIDCHEISTVKKKKHEQLNFMTVEETILACFHKMMRKFAKKWIRSMKTTSEIDLFQECCLRLIQAMYSWLPSRKVSLCTFLYRCLNTHMIEVRKKNFTQFGSLNDSDFELLSKYHSFMAQNPFSTFDNAVEALALNKKQAYHLTEILNLNAKAAYGCFETEDKKQDSVESVDLELLFQKANLNSCERELLKLSMSADSGWQTRYAKNHVSPKTQKPYTRMRVNQIYIKAKKKLAEVLERRENVNLDEVLS